MQVTPPPIEPLDNPIGELLLETVKAAPILPVKLMDAVADYVSYQSTPRMTIKPVEVDLEAHKLKFPSLFNKDKS